MQNISLIMAMRSEAEPLIKSMRLQRQHRSFQPKIPFELFLGRLGTLHISLLASGKDPEYQVDNVATVPATLMTYLAIEKFAPDMVINAGTAGGRSDLDCRIGDVYLSSGKFFFHDRRIPLPGFEGYGLGLYPSFDTSAMAGALHLKTGIISTGNSLDMTRRDLQIIKANRACIKDMEAAAVAWVCRTLSIPMFAVKAITDLIDQDTPTESQFMANLHRACSNLHIKTLAVLGYLQEGR